MPCSFSSRFIKNIISSDCYINLISTTSTSTINSTAITMSSIEQDKVQLCTLCGKQSIDYKSFKTFLEHSCKGVTFTCQDCNYPFATKKSLQVHVLSIHKKKTFHCDICNKDFSNIANLSRHEKDQKTLILWKRMKWKLIN